jgi:hypothetical protein
MEPGVFEFDEHQLFDTVHGVHIMGHVFDPNNGVYTLLPSV